MSIKVKMQEDKSLPSDGVFGAVVAEIKETESQYGPAVKIWFEIINDAEHEGKKISLLSNLKLTSMSKLYGIIKSLKPELSEMEINDEIDLEKLIGCKAHIELEKKDGSDFPSIKRVLPWKE